MFIFLKKSRASEKKFELKKNSRVRKKQNFKEQKVEFWPLNLTECLFFKGKSRASEIFFYTVECGTLAFKTYQIFIFENNSDARKKKNFKQQKPTERLFF